MPIETETKIYTNQNTPRVGNVLMVENVPEVPLKACVVAIMMMHHSILGQVVNSMRRRLSERAETEFKPYVH